jgi:hypothetical protein
MVIESSSLFIYVLNSTTMGLLQSQHEYKTTATKQTQGQNKLTNEKNGKISL